MSACVGLRACSDVYGAEGMSRPQSAGLKWLSASLMLFGLGWIAYLLVISLDSLEGVLPESWWVLLLASTLVAAGMAMNGVLFYLFLAADKREEVPLGMGRVLSLHFSGQLLRYLPGRFWGYVYQAGVTHGEVSKASLARANIDLMLYSIVGSAIVAGVVVTVRLEYPLWTAVIIALAGMAVIGVLFMGGVGLLLHSIGRVLPERLNRVVLAIADSGISAGMFLIVNSVFLLSWVAYLAGWNLLGTAYPAYAQVDFITLGALYSLASIIGILAAITPAGLGVREASFIVLSTGVAPSEVIAYFALFGRVWLLAIELVLCASPFIVHYSRKAK